jgi:TonB family protein
VARALPTARRARLARDSTLWIAALAALAVHGMILGTVHALGLSISSARTAGSVMPRRRGQRADDVELKSTCAGNAAFATSGRTALCFAPWVDDVDRCLSDAQVALSIDLSACQSRNDPATAIAMVDQKTADRLTPIDAERLLEEIKPELKPPPPPQVALAVPPPPPPPQAAPAPPPAPPQQQKLPQQIVETVKPKDEKEPDNARFLAEYNTKVDKQTVARGARNEPMAAKAKPEELIAKQKPEDEPSVTKHEPDRLPGINEHAPDVPGHLSMRAPGDPSPSPIEQELKKRGTLLGGVGAMVADGLSARRGDAEIEQQRRERSEIPRGDGGAGGGAPRVPDLKPSQQVLERLAGGGSVDRLDDVENGDETALSAKQFRYAGFFNRVKRQVAQNWEPGMVLRRRDPTGTVFGTKTRVTELRVSLSRRGELANIVVVTASGITELDDEAVRAFRSAGPFPNPPDGLVQKDNLITFAFGFTCQLGAPKLSWHMPTSM